MKEIFKYFLFGKNILVSENELDNDAGSVIITLAKLYNIKVIKGGEFAKLEHIKFVAERLGRNIPESFYMGFPKSVLKLSIEKYALDQVYHYFNTYGCGNFDEQGHSVFEETFDREVLKEAGVCKKISIVTEDKAISILRDIVTSSLKSTRPISDSLYKLVAAFLNEYDYSVDECLCKDTAIKLLIDTHNVEFADFISFSDICKLVEYINIIKYNNKNVHKLNLKNQDRKLIISVIDYKLNKGECNIRECFEKQSLWCGILHHIHYKAKNSLGERFVHAMREEHNQSVYSEFERAIEEKDFRKAINCLKMGKGSGAVIRNINYMLSRCENTEDIDCVLENLKTKNPIVLIQLYIQHMNYKTENGRTFRFISNNMINVHKESADEVSRRKSIVSKDIRDRVVAIVYENLRTIYKNKLGIVYIDEKMKKIALPLQETASLGGFGVLPKGSRLPLKEGNIIRGFTYWERVDDIDLSVIGVTKDGGQIEFSWRTMLECNSPAIVYSGDQTSGYKGGSEYYDIDIKKFREEYPYVKYLVFTNNVYSCIPFKRCICKAGYMIREEANSGEVFEPKTVATSFDINCDSTYAYLFGIDLDTNELLWLNIARSGSIQVAGTTPYAFLLDYFNLTSIINVYDLFWMLASELTDDPSVADVVVTDEEVNTKETAIIVHSCDIEKIMEYMNMK